MARSMTGFGKGQCVCADRKCSVEIKSVNSKYCDMQIRLPRILNGIENRIRNLISSQLQRGKIDVYISYDDYRDDYKEVIVDSALVKAYKSALSQIAETLGNDEKVYATTISKFSDVLKVQTYQPDDEELWGFVQEAIAQAIDSINTMRETEGATLVNNILEKSNDLKSLHSKVCERAPFVVAEFAERLSKRIADLAGDLADKKIDETRLATEVTFFADKCSIDEETVRLQSHIEQLESTLKENGAIGKKLDFLIQEINREINTIGSKANDLTITRIVVDMKTQMENVREQIQNME
jgi:uncharacterized protein (TIGR00255 family)